MVRVDTLMQSVLNALSQGATVVTANNRLARHLKWHTDRIQSSQGRLSWISADIVPWQMWLERQWEQSLLADGVAGRLDLLSDHEARLVWLDTLNDDSPDSFLINKNTSVRIVQQGWRIIRQWHINLQALKQAAVTIDSETFYNRVSRYDAECRNRHYLDPDVLADWVRKDIESGVLRLEGSLLFAGFVTWTPQQRKLQQAIEAAGIRVGFYEPGAPAKPAVSKVVSFDDPQHEMESVARWCRHMLEADAEVLGVLVPDIEKRGENLRRILLDQLVPDWRAIDTGRLPVNLSQGRTLDETGPVHVALLLLQWLGDALDFRSVGQLLRTPYLHGGETESAARARLDIRMREESQREVSLQELFAVAKVRAPQFALILEQLLSARSELGKPREPGHWVSFFDNLLGLIGWPAERSLTSDEHQSVRAWQKLLESFVNCNRVLGTINFSKARRTLDAMARERRFQPEGRMDAVQVMSLREAQGQNFDAIWICGMTADVWPPPARTSPLIPLFLQREAGVPEASPVGHCELSSRLFDSLKQAAPVVIASWPKSRDQEILIPSPAVLALPEMTADELPVADAESYRDRIYWQRELEVLESDSAPALTDGETIRGGSSLLKHQSQCPARAFFQLRLGAEEMPSPSFGINALTRGNIAHDALELFYGQFDDQQSLIKMPESVLDNLIDQSVTDAIIKHIPDGNRLLGRLAELEKERLRGLLLELVALDKARDDFVIQGREVSINVEIGPLRLQLRQDRLDRFADGGCLVLDYKTGQKFSLSDWKSSRPKQPQLPLYAATVGHAEGIAVVLLNQDGVRVRGVGSRQFGFREIQEADRFGVGDIQTWEGLVRHWHEVLAALATEFADGDCRFDIGELRPVDGDFTMLVRVHDKGIIEAGGGT